MINEHAEICKQGAAVLEAELRKPHCDRLTVCAIHSTPEAPGEFVLGIPAPEDAPGGFTVVHPGGGIQDWRAVPYAALLTRLVHVTGRLPILPYSLEVAGR